MAKKNSKVKSGNGADNEIKKGSVQPEKKNVKKEEKSKKDKSEKTANTGHEVLKDSETDNSEETFANADEKLAEVTDRYIRLSAEFDNYRKRTLREKMELSKNAGEQLLLRILPVMDDFERALKLMDSNSDCKAMKEGIDLIYNKFRDFLKQSGVKEIEALGSEFDVETHEAITKVPAQDKSQKGKVIDVVEKGYYLNDKIIRFPKVVVGD